MLLPDYTSKFKKDYKRAMKRNYDISLIDAVICDLIDEIPLDEAYRDYDALSGDYEGCRECHIKPDWLLIYQIGDGIIAFVRTGTHSDLFE
jgi:mRNA interferase YafQ